MVAGTASLVLLFFARGGDLRFPMTVSATYCFLLAAAWALDTGRSSWSGLLDGADSLLVRADAWLAGGRRGSALLAVGVALYATAWSVFSILRHEALNTAGFDLAIQHQVVWNLAHGRGFESSIEVANYLGDHVALTLPLFAPLLWIWDDVRILLIAQSLVLALGAVPVYRIALRRLGRADAIVWSAVYLLTPAIGFMNKYDFHDLILALPFLLAALDAMSADRLRLATVWLLLAAATREEVGLVVAALGVWAAVARRRWRWGILVAVVACAWSVVALFVVLPHFREGETSDTIARYAWLGDSPGAIAKNLITHPWKLFETSYHRARRAFFPMQLLWPFGWLPALSPGRLACLLPNLGLSMTSGAISQNSIYFQYNAPILPILFWSGVEGMRRLRSGTRPHRRGRVLLWILFSLLAANVADPATLKSLARPYTYVDGIRPRANRDTFFRAAALVPPDGDVLASNDLAPHLSERRRLHVAQFAHPNPPTTWIILDVTDTRHLEDPARLAGMIQTWRRDGPHAVRFFEDGILLLERGGAEDPDAARRLDAYIRSVEVSRRLPPR